LTLKGAIFRTTIETSVTKLAAPDPTATILQCELCISRYFNCAGFLTLTQETIMEGKWLGHLREEREKEKFLQLTL